MNAAATGERGMGRTVFPVAIADVEEVKVGDGQKRANEQ